MLVPLASLTSDTFHNSFIINILNEYISITPICFTEAGTGLAIYMSNRTGDGSRNGPPITYIKENP